jgi:hypothetical protein
MKNLFEKIPKGSILLWNVDEDKDLPKKNEMSKLLGIKDFTYYKSRGHHRNYIQSLTRLKALLAADLIPDYHKYWSEKNTSHFLFTAQEIESNHFFTLNYSTKCLGSYFVDKSDIDNLNQLLRRSDQIRRIALEIKDWPKRIELHKEEIKKDGIEDSFINNFQIQQLAEITNGYGNQANDHARSKLQEWHDLHYWKNKKSKQTVNAQQDDAVTV